MSRRDFLELGALGGGSGLFGQPGSPAREGASTQPRAGLHTRACDTLGVEYPIVQAPMQFIATPRLVAAVSEAGGLGILAGIGQPIDELRRQIREVRGLTSRPFGVNLILHSALRPPVDTAVIPDEIVHGVHAALNRIRARLGLAPRTERPPRLPDLLPAAFDVLIDERVPVFSTGLGLPSPEMVSRCRAAGIKVMCMVATPPDAREAERLGADVIVAQGSEAGGHRSIGVKPASPERAAIGGLALIPQIASAVSVPVVAAGGIMDGRGIAAALMLGASGALMGTRFIATMESGAPPFYKQALVDGDSDRTTLSDAFTGHYARFLRNDFIEQYRASGAPVFPAVVQQLAARDIVEAAAKNGDPSFYPLYAGQGVGMIDTVPAATDLVRSLVDETRQAMRSLSTRVTV